MNASCRLLYLLPRNTCTVKLLTQIKLLIPTSYTTPTYNPLSYLPTCLPRNTFHSLPLTDLLHTLQNIITDLPTYNTTPNIMWTTYLLTTQHPTSCVPRTYQSTYLQDKQLFQNEQGVLTSSCNCICKPCPEGMRLCPSINYCLNETSWCNGVVECPEDELDCPTTTPGKFGVVQGVLGYFRVCLGSF